MTDDRFPGMPKTSKEAFAAASRLSAFARTGFTAKKGHAPLHVQADRLRKLGAWLANQEFEVASAAAERRARARMAQFESSATEAW